jgi:hypothetical protein
MRRLGPAVALVSVLTSIGTAGQAIAVPQKLIDTRVLLVRLYPDLQGKALAITFGSTPDGAGLDVRVHESLDQSRTVLRAPLVRHMLDAVVDYDADRTLKRFLASGPWLHATDNARLRERLSTTTQPEAVLTDERARFSVKSGDAALTSATVETLATTIGAFTTHSTDLRTVARDASSSYGAVWEVKGQAVRGTSVETYALQFEPYGGRLVGITRAGGAR